MNPVKYLKTWVAHCAEKNDFPSGNNTEYNVSCFLLVW